MIFVVITCCAALFVICVCQGSEHPPADEVFAMLAGEGKQELGRLQLISLADDLLLAVAAIFNSAQPGYRQHATLHEEF